MVVAVDVECSLIYNRERHHYLSSNYLRDDGGKILSEGLNWDNVYKITRFTTTHSLAFLLSGGLFRVHFYTKDHPLNLAMKVEGDFLIVYNSESNQHMSSQLNTQCRSCTNGSMLQSLSTLVTYLLSSFLSFSNCYLHPSRR